MERFRGRMRTGVVGDRFGLAAPFRGKGYAEDSEGMSRVAVRRRWRTGDHRYRVKADNVVSRRVLATLGFVQIDEETFTFLPARPQARHQALTPIHCPS